MQGYLHHRRLHPRWRCQGAEDHYQEFDLVRIPYPYYSRFCATHGEGRRGGQEERKLMRFLMLCVVWGMIWIGIEIEIEIDVIWDGI